MTKTDNIPETQSAIQLVGPEQLVLNDNKKVYDVGPHQILAKVEAVGLCFSDLKLLKQFSRHARKGRIVSGIDRNVLQEIPSYKPEDEPTVPGHEAVCTIVTVGENVKRHKQGQRVLVQTDYRWLKTAESNAAFGYNFEGALQQYVLMDERVIIEPESDTSFLICADGKLSCSAVALIEPWACVESSYVTEDRNSILPDARLLVVAEAGREVVGLRESFSPKSAPNSVTVCCQDKSNLATVEELMGQTAQLSDISGLDNESFDDIVYFGSNAESIEVLNDKVAAGGIINVVLGGRQIPRNISISVGRMHYGMTRWVGTYGNNAAESYANVPHNGEIRDGDSVLVTGAAGPMGQMHVIRLICSGKKNLSITAVDLDDLRLKKLEQKAGPLAEEKGVELILLNPQKDQVKGPFDYFAIMAPLGKLVSQAIDDSNDKALINIFAGIAASVKQQLDLNKYIGNHCYMFGTSGSRLSDMKIVREKVSLGMLDTNLSVDAVSGMAGAKEGLAAVQNRKLAGKAVVYPGLLEMGLIRLEQMHRQYPNVAERMKNGVWSKAAEEELLKIAR